MNPNCTCYTYNCRAWRLGISRDPCGMCSDCTRADAAKASCPVHVQAFRYETPGPLELVAKKAA